jgi:outer membrane protein assembly factor BamB
VKSWSAILVFVIIVASFAAADYYGLMRAAAPAKTDTVSQFTGRPSGNETTADWPTYHKDLSRSGFEPDITSFSSTHLDWKSVELDGDVYAEPLVVGTSVIIATENDSVYDLDANTGGVIWRTHLGTPVRGGELPCGDIDPSGITGTPAIDTSKGVVYVAAFVTPAHHELFALDLATGTMKFHILIDAPGADPKVEQQRAALALSSGYVYVAYGGLFGDCGPYHGWVVASRADGNGSLLSYQVQTGRAGGIWSPSGPAFDNSGNLYVATGNSDSNLIFDFGNSVIRLSPDLKQLDWFAPANWIQLDVEDMDLGSAGPIVLNSNFVFQIGKEGIGYLLDSRKLGGINGQVYSAQVCDGPYHGAYGGLAYSPPYLVIPCTDGVVALETNLESKPSFSLVWRGPNFVPGLPVIAGNAVWTVDTRNGVIHALSLGNGQALFQDAIGPVTHFTSLSVGDGRIFVSGNRQAMAYQLQASSQQQSSYEVTKQLHLAELAKLQISPPRIRSNNGPDPGVATLRFRISRPSFLVDLHPKAPGLKDTDLPDRDLRMT